MAFVNPPLEQVVARSPLRTFALARELVLIRIERFSAGLTVILDDGREAFQIALGLCLGLIRTKHAADTRKTFVVERTIRQIVFVNELPHVGG